jgi:hypothetical protein
MITPSCAESPHLISVVASRCATPWLLTGTACQARRECRVVHIEQIFTRLTRDSHALNCDKMTNSN